MQKSLYLWSHQHVTGKMVISLKIQQNIDLLQRVTLKTGHEIVPDTVANATKITALATKIQKLVAKLATRSL